MFILVGILVGITYLGSLIYSVPNSEIRPSVHCAHHLKVMEPSPHHPVTANQQQGTSCNPSRLFFSPSLSNFLLS